MRQPTDILRTARITEKAATLSETQNKYVFEVDPSATKQEIRIAVETVFKKKVNDVNTMNVSGKRKRQRSVRYGRTKNWKKAIVTLAEGERIDLI